MSKTHAWYVNNYNHTSGNMCAFSHYIYVPVNIHREYYMVAGKYEIYFEC